MISVVMDMFFLLKQKHEVFETFKVFKAEVGLQLGKKIKALRSDRGGEYLSQEFKDYLSENEIVDKTSYEIWHGKVPNLSYLKVWGCETIIKETMGYYFYFPPENKVIVVWYGDFLERDLISQKFRGRDYDLEDDHMDTLPSENTSEIPVEPESLGPPSELILIRAMDEEMKSIKVNKVWIVVNRLPNATVVRNKWLYKKKTDMDGKLHTYKARLVAKGCTQTFEIDYQETISPVADITVQQTFNT
nr:hypothetical protein [Tanacetum cinerariifolium]